MEEGSCTAQWASEGPAQVGALSWQMFLEIPQADDDTGLPSILAVNARRQHH